MSVIGKWIELEIMLNEIRLRKANVACFLSCEESIFKYMYIVTCMYIHMFNIYYMFKMKMEFVRREQRVYHGEKRGVRQGKGEGKDKMCFSS